MPFEKEYARSDGRRVPVLIGAAAIGTGAVDSGKFYVVDLSHRKRSIFVQPESALGQVLLLSARQRLICLLTSLGQTQKRIASLLDVGLRTVELEKQRVAKTLELPTTAVTLWAVENRAALMDSISGSDQISKSVEAVIRHWRT